LPVATLDHPRGEMPRRARSPATSTEVVRRRTRVRRPLLVLAMAVAGALLLPFAFLCWQAASVGWSNLSSLLFRGLTRTLLWNTVRLLVVVTALSALIGTATAWCVERTNLPGRRLVAVLLVLPLAVPDFVIGYGWITVWHGVEGFWGAVLVMTAGLYPLVYLPVAASLRSGGTGLEEVARSLGMGRVATFCRVTLAEARVALLGGCLLVALGMLAEYGAFEMLGYHTFTTEIYTELQVGFDSPAACALSLVLVVLCLILLTGEVFARGRAGRDRPPARVAAGSGRARLGRGTLPALAGCLAVVVTALGVPVGTIIYWLVLGGTSTLPPGSVLSATEHTALYSACAALVATSAALPVALLSVRHPGRLSMIIERSTYLVMGLPGLVIALAFTFFAVHDALGLYQSPTLLVLAYAVLFFPLALVGVRASVARTSPGLEEVGRSLGRRPLAVLARVTVPLAAPGLAAAFCLVFLSAVTELTTTLVLIPTNQQTLATQFWAYTTNLSYGAAAPYAALMIGIAVVPTYVLGRWFDRLPSRGGGAR
jgi:iron(III) transport system permease protein